MSESDVKLMDNQVKIEAWDLCLDSKDRRKNDSEHRRALVHDDGDRLTLNWGGDYPGGVKIGGNAEVDGDLKINGQIKGEPKVLSLRAGWFDTGIVLKANDLILVNKDASKAGEAAIKTLSHVDGDKLVINQGGGYNGGVEIEGKVRVSGVFHSGKAYFSQIALGFDNPLTVNHEQYLTVDRHSITVHNIQYSEYLGAGPSGELSKTNIDLVEELLNMMGKIEKLEKRIKTLESKS